MAKAKHNSREGPSIDFPLFEHVLVFSCLRWL